MKFEEIECMALINDVDPEKVNEIAESIKKNGFIGCPILVYNDMLLTGSHRLAALEQLADEDYESVMDLGDVAEDVTDIVEANYAEFTEENGYERDIDYSQIGWLLKGSWVEEYADEICEW